MNSSFAGLAGLMFVAGIGIPVMAAINSRLGGVLGGAQLAVIVLLCVGFVAASVFALSTGGHSVELKNLLAAPWYLYLGGLIVAFYLLSITWAAPKFGVGNAIFFVLIGQLVSAAIIDHFGLFGAQQVQIRSQRISGIILMAAGVFLASAHS